MRYLALLLVFSLLFAGCPSQPGPPAGEQLPNASPDAGEQVTVPDANQTPAGPDVTPPEEEEEPEPQPEEVEEPEPPHERITHQFYKGVWMPAIGYPGVQSMEGAGTMEEYGINTAAFAATVTYRSDGTIVTDDPMLMGQMGRIEWLIDDYHEHGIAVMLTIEPMAEGVMGSEGPGPIPEDAREKFLQEVEVEVLRWAELAEEKGVEMFAPMNEPDRKLGEERAVAWSQEILPKIREVYTGKVVWKGDLGEVLMGTIVQEDEDVVVVISGRKLDFSGYDVLGFTTAPHGNYPEYGESLEVSIDVLLVQTANSGVPEAMITEAWVSPLSGLSDQEKANAFQIVYGEAQGRVSGVFYLDQPLGDPGGTPLAGTLAGEKVKELFTTG